MNYVWEYAISANNSGKDINETTYVHQEVEDNFENYSAYTELSTKTINAFDSTPTIIVNPYYRYGKIFSDLLKENDNTVSREIKHVILNTAMHLLTYVDRKTGMNKTEYYINFIINDIESGVFGENNREIFASDFDRNQKRMIAKNILTLYSIGEEIHVLRETFSQIFRDSYIFINMEKKNEFIFYLREQKTEKYERMVEFLLAMFLPIDCTSSIFWTEILGVIGTDDMMKIGKIALY
ncbi:MAG: hypothetical protein FWF80_09080 [Defluviitaleaceae bacterium]|nr:hypothetical protein [Defluviitaleaceae bacterium]